jgi:diguanylate cyclase (GGDEF)-like protein
VTVDGLAIELTASIGVAVAADGHSTPDSLVDTADHALYDAKRAGRDCVRVSGPEPLVTPAGEPAS